MNVKQVTRYETTNGRLFTDEAKANKYQTALDLVAQAESWLPKVSFGFQEYVQLTREQYDRFKRAFDEVIIVYHRDLIKHNPEQVIRGGILGRFLNDGDSPVYGLWVILQSIDDKLRWYNQPYYANHPAETVDFTEIDITV